MKLILFEESLFMFKKYNNFKYYIFELYTRLCFVGLLFFSLFGLFWEYRNEITVFILMFQKNFLTNHTFLISNEFFEIFYYNILLSTGLSLIGLFAFCIIHCFYFINPGLYKYESFFLKKIVAYEIFLIVCTPFLIGLIYIPIFWSFIVFLQQTTNDIGFFHIIELKSNFFIKTLFMLYFNNLIFGQCFLILIVLINFKNRLVIKMFKYRKFLYFGILLISTLITPPDIYSQIFCTFVLISCIEFINFNYCCIIKIKLQQQIFKLIV